MPWTLKEIAAVIGCIVPGTLALLIGVATKIGLIVW
jgi:hypothetical protein